MFEGIPTRNVVYEQGASSTTVIGSCDGAEGFLAGGVPDLEFDLFVVDCDHARTEFDTDGEVMYGLESLVCELEQEA